MRNDRRPRWSTAPWLYSGRRAPALQRSVLIAACLLIGLQDVHADPPLMGYIYPAGGQRGTQVSARVGGCNLYTSPKLLWSDDAVTGPPTLQQIETIWFEGPMIPQPASQQREDYPRDYGAPLTIPANAPLGLHTWRLATSQGVTSAFGFVVGDFPEIIEEEQEGDTPAVGVTLPVTINGRIFPREDVDSWRFSASAGQVVTCHVATATLGSPLDARLVIVDASGKTLAESIPVGEVTPPLRLTIPQTGEYQVRIHDIGFQGLQNHVYRLTVTAGPVLDAVYPLGGRRGTSPRFQLDGVNLSESEATITLPAVEDSMLYHLPDSKTSFGNVRLELDDFPELIEPADMRNESFTAPSVLNGRILSAGEEDTWKFKATKGLEYDFDVRAARCGSPLDVVMSLCDATEKVIQEVDDSPGLLTDARLRWTAPDDGDYQIRVRDQLPSRGGRQFAYRIRVTTPAMPEFRLKLVTDSANLERGQSMNLKVAIDRGPGFKEPVEISIDGLPAGLSMTSPAVIAANQQEIQVSLKAEKDVKVTTVPLRISGTAKVGDAQIKQTATIASPSGPQQQDSLAIVQPDSPFWISTTIPTPFKFVGVFESKYIPRGGMYIRKYRIERNGFEGPLDVHLADRQGRHLQGVTAKSVAIGPNQNEFEIAVELPSWMEVGRTCRSTLAVCGMTQDADGQSHTISFSSNDQHNQMIALVATGRLTIQLPQSTLPARPNVKAELPIRIQRSPGIVAPVTVELVTPKSVKGLKGTPIKIEAEQNSGTMTIEFGTNLTGINVAPITIRATTEDERQLPVTAEAKLSMVIAEQTRTEPQPNSFK